MQPYQQAYQEVNCGLGNLRGNPDNKLRGKFGLANCRFPLVISARPWPVRSSDRHPTPPADPSLPTTEEGISDRVRPKTITNGAGARQIFVIQTQMDSSTQWTVL